MLPRLEMSRDECRKCLRCLELDAYANMVSVFRAQGPFTLDKKNLLEELASVLHISNERHRAEIRRAVNDDKLSTVAEQLNGPNTGTDWACEGRRSVPLLPRLKAHTAFTTLANSLSVVSAVACEKQPRVQETEEKPPIVNLENRKRKRSSELSDGESNDCNNVRKKNNFKLKFEAPIEVPVSPSSCSENSSNLDQSNVNHLENVPISFQRISDIAQSVDNGVETEQPGVNVDNEKDLSNNVPKVSRSDLNSNTCVQGTRESEKSVPGSPNDPKSIRNNFSAVKISKVPASKMSPKLTSKKKVLVLQKGPLREITLSHGGKEVLGKVIMGGKNLRLASQQKGNPLSFLQRVPPCNGDQSVNIMSNAKTNNNVLDSAEKKKACPEFNELPEIFDVQFETALANQNSEFVEAEKTKKETVEEGHTTVMEGIFDPKTGICDFQATGESLSNVEIEELSNSGIEILNSEESENILEATESSMLIIDEIDEFRDS